MLRPLAIKINKVQPLRFPINLLLNSSINILPIIQRCSLEQQEEEQSALQKALRSLKEKAKPESSATSEVHEHNPECIPAMDQCYNTEMKKLFLKQMFQNDKPVEVKKDDIEAIMKEIDAIISKIVGMDVLKLQLSKWIKGLALNERRKTLDLKVGTKKPLHMAFLGNPGTGKTIIARLLATIFNKLGIISEANVVEVQRTDLISPYVGCTGPKTRKKIKKAHGGILFVDEAYRLITRDNDVDFGREALEEIMAHMDDGNIIVIFAGYTKDMQRVISANAGFSRRVSKFFYFDDYSPEDIATILQVKMKDQEENSFSYGYILHQDCTVEAMAKLIKKHTTEEQLKKFNGGLVKPWLVNALENMDLRLDASCSDGNSLLTITLEDLEEGLKSLAGLQKLKVASDDRNYPVPYRF